MNFILVALLCFQLIIPLITFDAVGNSSYGTKVIGAGDKYSFSFQAGKGDLSISWEVTDWNNDNIFFNVHNENNEYISQINDVNSFSDTVYIEAGIYDVEWENNNWIESLTISYTLTYDSYDKVLDDPICCSSYIILIIGLLSVGILTGLLYKKKLNL